MKALLIAIAAALSLGSVAQADPPKDSERSSREERKKRFMEKFDKNKDGKIDDKEKEAMRAEFAKRRGHAGDRKGHGHHKGHGHKKSEAKKKGGDARSDWRKRGEEMKKKFMEKYDKNKNGKIDDEEKEAAREAFGKRASEWMKDRAEKSAAHLIIELDKNKDGRLNVDEVPEPYRKDFGKTDKNGDGYVDKDELHVAMAKVHEAWRKKLANHRRESSDATVQRFMKLDKNGDGKLNVDEIGSRLRSKFSDVDTNGDGYIDAAEIKKRLSSRHHSGRRTRG